VTDQLKDRFKIILGKFLQKRAEKQFSDIQDMILNFDNDSTTKITSSEFEKMAKNLKKQQKTDVTKGIVNSDINNLNLEVVAEESMIDDLEESSIQMVAQQATPLKNVHSLIEMPNYLAQPMNLPQSEDKIKQPPTEKEAVQMIERLFTRRLQRSRSKLIIEKIKSLPFPVRAGFVNLQMAKKEQSTLKTQVNRYMKKNSAR